MKNVLTAVEAERRRQDALWGPQRHDFATWLVILMEEVGETAEALQREHYADMREELIQVAAVAVAAVEHLDTKLN